ncbi:sorting nexin-10B [Latimeria chalumnae]|uniref:sorting nexin-10B n=1 Tax=Latimeria chalumnae TaxID=7897 RepID=UPI00313C176F
MAQQEFVNVWVRDPRIQKKELWYSHISYEICIHTNSMCFTLKTSCVRRRYREFAWLREQLQKNAPSIVMPELPAKIPFFNPYNLRHVEDRRRGLQEFLEKVLQMTILLSDSRVHLFLQSQLSPEDIEACVSGQTKYSVTEAIQSYAFSNRRFPIEEEEKKKSKNCSDSDSKSSSLGLGHSNDDSVSQGYKRNTSQGECSSQLQTVAPREQVLP